MQARIPVSTYRLQFNQKFNFEQAAHLLDYFQQLGVSDIYSSPILTARAGSLHGYDVVDHSKVNPELGTEDEFVELAHALRARGMGVVMDTVPNHMCVASSENRWWMDVLENGPSSTFARYFDIDWHPPKENFAYRVLLPILGEQYGRVLENQEIKISYRGGSFFANYYETSLPIAARTSTHILRLALAELRKELDETDAQILELESIITALNHLPPRTEANPEKIRERRREKEVVKRRLSTLMKESQQVRHAVHAAIIEINGRKGDARSFDKLEELLAEQAYRLCYWRVAADEINYRRFFDINELAALRVEERPVFTAVHEVIFRLIKRGAITGLRIDHVDGLFNPEKYLSDLQRACLSAMKKVRRESENGASASARLEQQGKPFYIVVEKILECGERLRDEWPVYGTTGYEFMNLLNGLFVDSSNRRKFEELYGRFTGETRRFADVLYESKKLILRAAMSSELHVLARHLNRISEKHRWSRDFTLNSLQYALGEVVACFPVYRSYVRRKLNTVSDEDRQHVQHAIRAAKRRNPTVSESIYDFIESILLLRDPKGLTESEKSERRDFVMRFQQLTSPVTAKGLEDTAFYRYYPLASLNEVGGDPEVFGVSVVEFHSENLYRMKHWPASLSATSTHDTKRSEDLRARLNVLSEIPEEWERAIKRWSEINREKKKDFYGLAAPDANEEYLLYQTLVGTWPFAPMSEAEHAEYVGRIQEYMNKALKEAKVHTSWIRPDEARDNAVRDFIGKVCSDNQFLKDFEEFLKPVARAGLLNSLSHLLLKTASPGVPDFYQGTEVWNFALVDPDNRRPVDYERQKSLLSSLCEESRGGNLSLVEELMLNPADDRLKLYTTSRALQFRCSRRELFAEGAYVPLEAVGPRARHVIAFARRFRDSEAIIVASRFFMPLPLEEDVWRGSAVSIGVEGIYREVFTGLEFHAERGCLPLAKVLRRMPVALLERIS